MDTIPGKVFSQDPDAFKGIAKPEDALQEYANEFFTLPIRGESHYLRTLKEIKAKSACVFVTLRPEPDNPHDPRAIKVVADGDRTVGYLSRENAADYFQAIVDWWNQAGLLIGCRALLIGGDEDRPNIGIWLDMITPEQLSESLKEHPKGRSLDSSTRSAEQDESEEQDEALAHINFKLDTIESSHGHLRYVGELTHTELHKHRRIVDHDENVVLLKARLQAAQWEEQWERKRERERGAQVKEDGRQLAESRTREAQDILENLRGILLHTLERNDTIDWELLKNTDSYPHPKPEKATLPERPKLKEPPIEPSSRARKYEPRMSALDRIVGSRRKKRIEEARLAYTEDHLAWQRRRKSWEEQSAEMERAYEDAVVQAETSYQESLADWNAKTKAYENRQRAENESIDRQRERWLAGDSDAIEAYCDMVLSNSEYEDFFPKEFDMQYNADDRTLIVNYLLPPPSAIPTLTEVRYVVSRRDFAEKHLPATKKSQLYDDSLYQVTLRTIHELLEADTIEAIDSVIFNGVVRSIDGGTGREVELCVLSVQAGREEFLSINLERVDPKACFRRLEGVSSSKLSNTIPITPIITIAKEDGPSGSDGA